MALKIRPRSEPSTSAGRPPKDFQDLSLRSKRQITSGTREKHKPTPNELLDATATALAKSQKRIEAKVVKAVIIGFPNIIGRFKSALHAPKPAHPDFYFTKVLALITDNKKSKRKYGNIP